MNFSKALEDMMKSSNLTQIEISRKSGVCNSSISDYLNGTSIPNMRSFFKIVDACGYRIVLKKKEVK